MPEQNLDALASAFRDVRGADEDALWLAEASAFLTMRGLDHDSVIRRTTPLLSSLRASGLSALDTFGPAHAWAANIAPEEPDRTARKVRPDPVGLILRWLAYASGIAAAFLAVGILSTSTHADPLTPFLIGSASSSLIVCFQLMSSSAGRPRALVVTLLLGVAICAVITWGILRAEPSAWLPQAQWPLLATAASIALASGITLALRRHHSTQPVSHDDEAWAREATRALHDRGDVAPHDVRRVIREAREYSSDSGTPLHDEFGSPDAFAASLPAPARTSASVHVLLVITAAASLSLSFRVTSSGEWDLISCALIALIAASVATVAVRSWRSRRRS
ncbi:hypothetical protein BKA24_002571 [Microbacterium marinum]|uniref:Uncharacterized protein n=1 Tax=Microbacterium marinum TaxID=421115 RepID=A0A7W7BS55_9MICO|nr:hypothetical protein [Microbacterium marinum]MBB4667862.1 hypothetical protein [Microbacterium marinum]